MKPQLASGAPTPQAAFLVETTASNLHLHAVEVLTICASVSAAARSGDATLLHACRYILGDTCKPMRLALRFGAEFGLSDTLASAINALYAEVNEAKRTVYALGAAPAPGALQAQAQRWRRAAVSTLKALDAFHEAARSALDPVYGEDARALRLALRKAADGDESLVDRTGALVLPTLRQRRRNPRLAVERSATLHLPSGSVKLRIEDMSREGMGIVCAQPLAVGQEIALTLDNGRKVQAVVASARGQVHGLSLRTPLSQEDMLGLAS